MRRIGDFIVSQMTWLVALLSISSPAHAVVNAGAEGGLVKRSADAPSNLGVGLGVGLHAEFDVARWLEVGPYYLHAALPNEGVPSVFDAVVQTAGIRARWILPLPVLKPYAYAGLGYEWISYTMISEQAWICGEVRCLAMPTSTSGHFFELPLGVGAALQVGKSFQFSLDAAYRPAFGFGGDAYDNSPAHARPVSGWSMMMGAALVL